MNVNIYPYLNLNTDVAMWDDKTANYIHIGASHS